MGAVHNRRIEIFHLLASTPEGLTSLQIAEQLDESQSLIDTALKPYKSNGVVIKLSGNNRRGIVLGLRSGVALSIPCESCSKHRYAWQIKDGKCPMCCGISVNKNIKELQMATFWFQLLTKPYAEMEFEHDSQSA